jgi:hypothetical protein
MDNSAGNPQSTAGLNILEYRRGEPAESILRRRWVRVMLFVVSLGAAVSPFLAFAYGYSPESVVEEWVTQQREWTLAMIGFPFFAGVVAAMWKLRITFDKPPSRAIRDCDRGVCAAGAVRRFKTD